MEDNSHPIPRLDTLDVHIPTDKGAYVGVVIASPLLDDEMSRARLKEKIDVSVSYFYSSEYRAKYGSPCILRSRLWIPIHEDSDPKMIALVDDYCAMIQANGVRAVRKVFDSRLDVLPANTSLERTRER